MGFLDRVLPRRHTPASGPRHALEVDEQPRSSQAERQDPIEVRIPPLQPPPPPPPPAAPRADVTQLLGRDLANPFAQEICREYALLPALGAGPARSYQSPSLGVSLLADDYGTVINIFLHFHGDLDFQPYAGIVVALIGAVLVFMGMNRRPATTVDVTPPRQDPPPAP